MIRMLIDLSALVVKIHVTFLLLMHTLWFPISLQSTSLYCHYMFLYLCVFSSKPLSSPALSLCSCFFFLIQVDFPNDLYFNLLVSTCSMSGSVGSWLKKKAFESFGIASYPLKEILQILFNKPKNLPYFQHYNAHL